MSDAAHHGWSSWHSEHTEFTYWRHCHVSNDPQLQSPRFPGRSHRSDRAWRRDLSNGPEHPDERRLVMRIVDRELHSRAHATVAGVPLVLDAVQPAGASSALLHRCADVLVPALVRVQ